MQAQQQADTPLPRVLSRRDVAATVGISVTTLWRLVKAGRFPAPFRVSPGRVGWDAATVARWIQARASSVEEVSEHTSTK